MMKVSKKTAQSDSTKQKLFAGIEKVLKEHGYKGLKVTNVSKAAEVDRKLIYFHFGDFENMLSEFLSNNDFWLSKTDIPETIDRESAIDILEQQFTVLFQNDTLKQLLVWQLSDKSDLVKNFASSKEEIGNKFIERFMSTNRFETDVPPLLALILGGIFYLNIHSTINGSTVCGIDINNKLDRLRVINTIDQLIKNLK